MNLARKSVVGSVFRWSVHGRRRFRLRWSARDFARFATSCCAAHFRRFRTPGRGGRVRLLCAERDPRGAVCFFSSFPPTLFPREKGRTTCGERRLHESVDCRIARGHPRSRRSLRRFLLPCIAQARGRARAAPRCATRYLCSTDHRRLRASHTRHPRHPPSRRKGGNNHLPLRVPSPFEKNSSFSLSSDSEGEELKQQERRGTTPIRNGSGTASTTMDQKRVYKLVLTGGM